MEIETQNIDHLGLVAGMCREIGLVETIDREAGNQAHNKHLTYGEVVMCMILNGLGFVGRTLYLYSEYFEDKPVDHLLEKDVQPEKIDDNVLGRTLDKLFELGVSELFTKIALQAVTKLGIEVDSIHIDSTSFHVDGEYNSLIEQGESCIKIVPGYSKDHRPDLNQVVLEIITSNQGNIPLYMQAANGNANDKTLFAETVKKHINSFKDAVNNRYIVGDSALYTANTIKSIVEQDGKYVSRVPVQIKEAKQEIESIKHDKLEDIGNGYKAYEVSSNYAGIEQRWVVYFSEQTYHSKKKTLNKNWLKGSEKEAKEFWHLCCKEFNCQKDAEVALQRFEKKQKYTRIENKTITEKKIYQKSGRPKKGQKADKIVFFVQGDCVGCLEKRKAIEESTGFFILATNDLNKEGFSASSILKMYKEQQSVERGFRFLKSPEFLVSSFFLKKPERIEALLMVMTLCLLIYAAIEYKTRKLLKELGEYFPDQKKRSSQNPTTRWIFYCFIGLHLIYVDKKKQQVTNLKERHRIILRCLGPPYQKFYYCEQWKKSA